MAMFLARIAFFRLHESPRYLVHAGRPQEAIDSLQMISRFNGDELNLGLEDVRDSVYVSLVDEPASIEPSSKHPASDPSAVVFDAGTQDEDAVCHPVQGGDERMPIASASSRDLLRDSPESESKRYDATGESNVVLEGHYYHTPQVSQVSPTPTPTPTGYLRGRPKSPVPPGEDDKHSFSDAPSIAAPRPVSGLFADDILGGSEEAHPRPRSHFASRASRRQSATSSMYEPRSKMYWRFPRWLRKPLWALLDRIAMVLAPEWIHTTLLVWAAWFAMSLGECMRCVRAALRY